MSSNMHSRFDEIIDLSQSRLVKWEYPSPFLPFSTESPPLPLWIADMDFKSPDEVQQALHDVVRNGLFSYTQASEAVFEAIIQWQQQYHHWQVRKEWILLTPGVVNSINLIIQTLTKPGDGVLLQPPIYNAFYQSIRLNERAVIAAPLTEVGSRYRVDLDAFERAITPNTRLFLLCNPHNPTGNVWQQNELRAMGEICLRHGVMVISDEIHQDLVLSPDKRYQPFASLSDTFSANSITCLSPSKTFNLAGLHTAILVIPNPELREALKHTYARCGTHIPNLLGLSACEAAYRHGGQWLSALLDYLRVNRAVLQDALAQMPQITLFDADALYLGWLDFRHSGIAPNELHSTLLRRAGLWLDDGNKFGADYCGFARINFACRKAVLCRALNQLQHLFDPR